MSACRPPLTYYAFWGKSDDEGGFHLLPYHCLDVAAVGRAFLTTNDCIRQRLAGMLECSEDNLVSWAVFFLGLHDIGKFARHFQALQPELFRTLRGESADLPYVRHDILGEVLWRTHLRPYCAKHGYLDITQERRRSYDTSADYWLHAMIGHHGKPVSATDQSVREVPSTYFPDSVMAAAESFLVDWRSLSVPPPQAALTAPQRTKGASWWLAGLAVLCDWLGSNREYFPFVSRQMPLSEYWATALHQAERAVVESGLVPARHTAGRTSVVFCGPDARKPTPLQEYCKTLALLPGAGLYLLEDLTGAGKTEAALILTQRLMAENGDRGVYFALPTMATANAMFERMGTVYRRLYAQDSTPSLVLAHGARRLHRGFRDAIEDYPASGADEYGDGTESAQFRCAGWLADNPKKSLLAEVGVGTIDQAVLGVLPSRHQSLRLLGLLGKVLIVDEVHAYDAYLLNLLKSLLTFHAASGGSTILLSATLPLNQRQALIDAYYSGIQAPSQRIKRIGEEEYPLLTSAGDGMLHEKVLASRSEVCRTVTVERIDTLEQAEALMAHAVAQGQCLCWVRNTVHDARQAWRQITARHPEWAVDLFHARYTLGDRLAIEDRVVGRFGIHSGSDTRKTQILIATPVVEQSLDIDFDHMITDLAPIDLIIQRAGRLHRHRRGQDGKLTHGEDWRGAPVLHIYAPEPVDEPDEAWFSAFLPKASYVYPNHARLWQGLRLLMRKGGFAVPGETRHLIEGVYGDGATFPPGLESSDIAATGSQSGEASLADYNALKVTAHYGATGGGRWWAEERTPTRLGDSIPVYLGQVQRGEIVPLRQEGDFPWQLSSLSMLRTKIAAGQRPGSISDAQWEQALAQLPAKGRWGALVVLDENGEGGAVDGRGENVPVRYCEAEGLLSGDEC